MGTAVSLLMIAAGASMAWAVGHHDRNRLQHPHRRDRIS
jgi:hypothetical protein